jgi:hypothetical protein
MLQVLYVFYIKGKHRLRIFNRVLGPEGENTTRIWRKMHNMSYVISATKYY